MMCSMTFGIRLSMNVTSTLVMVRYLLVCMIQRLDE
nr:MAG TPA: hypothetical protein [Caudoviricetes sp.]